MVEYTGRACDLCGAKEPEAKRFTIENDEGKLVIDLCLEHSKPLRTMIDQGRPGSWTKHGRRTRAKRRLDEIT